MHSVIIAPPATPRNLPPLLAYQVLMLLGGIADKIYPKT